eukprot:CAMPEP_0172311570 /NCGR_PEP_ID=MMETSP1058-20130122/15180_1 /TAXON_ID=83371 /ORGANISM="Detonula confervacea, Strain CCMP 353" /LENGTH=663 /DNA_ID=CAMNT_0013024799 /DNA_START=79 /DNA_END=2070 /DNA_ORIENTATION=+
MVISAAARRGNRVGAVVGGARWMFWGVCILASTTIALVRYSMRYQDSNQQLGDEPSNHPNHRHQGGNLSSQMHFTNASSSGAVTKAFQAVDLSQIHSTNSKHANSGFAAPPVYGAENITSNKNSSQANYLREASISPSTLPTTKIHQPQPEYMELSVSADAHSLGVVAPEFISSTLDWWPLGTEGWGNASVINSNLSHPNLVAAVRKLSPFFLRIGGSQADEIIYYLPQRNKDNASSTADLKIASQCKENPQRCLTKERWDEVLDFASHSGARIVFTIAYVRHTRDDERKNDQRDWDSSNAKQFLQYTANSAHAKLGTVFGFELGNELRHKGKVTNVTRIVNAYKELGQIVNDIWGNEERTHYHKPKILGPASTGRSETTDLIAEIGRYIQIASYHKYHGGGKDPALPEYASHPSFYSHPQKLSGPGDAVKKFMTNNSERAQLWIGEGAMAYNSGRQGLTDSFHGSMWFVNLLGALAKTKPFVHSVYCRQALLGGFYELISHETLIPNPDYWVAYLWKNIVGSKAIGPIQSPHRKDSVMLSSHYTFGCCKKPGLDSVLIHSFCATSNGDVVFIVINTSESRAIDLNVTMGKNRTEYLLRPNKEGFQSRQVLLNGQLMSIENGVLPEISGILRKPSEQFHIPPISIAFLVVHGTEVKECLRPAT